MSSVRLFASLRHLTSLLQRIVDRFLLLQLQRFAEEGLMLNDDFDVECDGILLLEELVAVIVMVIADTVDSG